MLLVWAPLASLSLAGQEHGRTIPLTDFWLTALSITASARPAALPKFLGRPAPVVRGAQMLPLQ